MSLVLFDPPIVTIIYCQSNCQLSSLTRKLRVIHKRNQFIKVMHGFFSNTFLVDILSEYNPFFTKQKYTKKDAEFIFFTFLLLFSEQLFWWFLVSYRAFPYYITPTILVFQSSENAAMFLVFQTNPVGLKPFSHIKSFFSSNKFA